MTRRFFMHSPKALARPLMAAAALGLACATPAEAQFLNRWLSAGSMHSWYSEAGGEREEGFVSSRQQNGLRWPALYVYTDAQAAMGFWMGAKNVTGPEGQTYATRMVHVGPRATGLNEFFPVKFEVVSRFERPAVSVDGDVTEAESSLIVDRVDPTLKADAMIYSEVNTLLGITVVRRIYQFSNEFHDNYHVVEVTATNTGNTDGDAEIEIPAQTLTDVVFSWMWRLAPSRNSRYVVGQSSGWGYNTMLDFRGDGLSARYNDPAPEDFPAMYAWHGYWSGNTVTYDNIGGPILTENVPQSASGVVSSDTLGRLAGHQFVGVAKLFASGPGSTTDDPAQPRYMTYIDSDDPRLGSNDAFTVSKMETEYRLVTDDAVDRHANAVTGSNDRNSFLTQRGDPNARANGAPLSQGSSTSGGASGIWTYGPYTMAPGQSVKIVYASASAGLSWRNAATVGRAYKQAIQGLTGAAREGDPVLPVTINGRSGLTKNGWVFTGRDSLFQTFRRARQAYAAGLNVDAPPRPPQAFEVAGGGDRIQLNWSYYPGESPSGVEVYRSAANYTERDTLIATLPGSATSYDDVTATRGIGYYYYIRTVGGTATGADGAPAGRSLKSSRYYTQTYSPATLQRPQGIALDRARVVPNPFYLGAPINVTQQTGTRYFDQGDKLGFLDIPGQCRIEIYTELGEKVAELNHTNGSGDEFWDLATASRQIVVSGIYIAVITVTEDIDAQSDVRDPQTGEVLFQAGERMYTRGETKYLKFAVIR